MNRKPSACKLIYLITKHGGGHELEYYKTWGCGVEKGLRGPYTGGLYVSSCCLRPAGVSGHSGQHRPVRPQSYLAISSKLFSPILMTITVHDMCLPHTDGRLVKAHKTKQK